MALLEIDVYDIRKEAEIVAKQHIQAGRRNVLIKEYSSLTLYECSPLPCKIKYDRDGSPLYLVFSEG
jgi:hypothetical protein